jgi:hypothetical protein
MLDKPPPSRMRVVEKGGRLIVIDTQTGQPPLTAAQQQGGKDDFAAADRSPRETLRPVIDRVSSPTILMPPERRPAAPEILRPTRPAKLATSSDRQGRVMMLVVGGIAASIFLIVTSLWVFVVVAMLIAPIRSFVLTAAKSAIKRFLDGAN